MAATKKKTKMETLMAKLTKVHERARKAFELEKQRVDLVAQIREERVKLIFALPEFLALTWEFSETHPNGIIALNAINNKQRRDFRIRMEEDRDMNYLYLRSRVRDKTMELNRAHNMNGNPQLYLLAPALVNLKAAHDRGMRFRSGKVLTERINDLVAKTADLDELRERLDTCAREDSATKKAKGKKK